MTIGAGDLKASITVQRATEVPNDLNEPVLSWADYYKCRARREDASSGEKEVAGQVGAFLMARFVVRRCTQADAIKSTDRILHEGTAWSIIEIMRVRDDPDRFIEIKAVRDADHAEVEGPD